MTKSRGINIINKGKFCPNHPDRPAHAKGLCKSCYNKRLLKSNTVYAKNQRKNYDRWVKENYEQHLAYLKNYNKNIHPRKRRDNHLRKKYGITLQEYEQLYKKQKGKCAICQRKTKKTLHVDHNHKTGKIRGLLCFRCNYGIGYFKDNLNQFKNIVKYLEANNG